MRGKLNKRSVDAISPRNREDVFLWDTELRGFGLRVKPSGVKSFLIYYYAPGLHRVRRKLTIGTYGPWTVEQARSRAIELRADIERGGDPARDRDDDRRAARDETVERRFADYLDYGRAHFKPSTVTEYERLGRLHVLPAIGQLPAARVTIKDVSKLHHSLRKRPITANRCVQLLKAMFNWLARSELVDGKNPAAAIELYPEVAKERFLTIEELGRIGHVLKTAETVGLAPSAADRRRKPKGTKRARNAGMFQSAAQIGPADPFAIAALRFLILTGWRKSEALTLTRSAVQFTTGVATLGDTKTGKSVRILPAPALELLSSLPQVDQSPYFFPGRDHKQPLEGLRRLWDAVRHHAELEDVRLHDLRHSVASVAGGHGYSLFLIGKLLGHKTARSTERYAHVADDVRKVMADTVGNTISAALEAKARVQPSKRKRRKGSRL